MFIVEGPDLSGKTTLIKKIQEISNWERFHVVKQLGGIKMSHQEFIYRCDLLSRLTNTVIDRHPMISEYIYGNIMRNDKTLIPDFSIIKDYFNWNNSVIIYCDPGLDHILKNQHYLKEKTHKPKEHVEEVQRNIVKIYDEYMCLMEHIRHHLKDTVIIHQIDFNNVTNHTIGAIINEYNTHKRQ